MIFDMGFLRLCVGFEVHISGFCHIYDKTLHGIVPVTVNLADIPLSYYNNKQLLLTGTGEKIRIQLLFTQLL